MSKLQTIAIGILFALGILALAYFAGARWQFERDRNAPARISIRIVERLVEIPVKVEIKPAARPNQVAEDRNARIDSLIAKARRADSLEALAWSLSQQLEATFEDTISVEDSSGSFYLREIHAIQADPIDSTIQKRTEYLDGIFKVKEKSIERVVIEPPKTLDVLKIAIPVAAAIILGYELIRK